MEEIVKIVVFSPVGEADKIRQVLGENGAGKIGNYDYCTFSNKGIGRFRPLSGANPKIGNVGELEAVEEERIETVCYRKDLDRIVKAVKQAHSYEEVVLDVYPIIMI